MDPNTLATMLQQAQQQQQQVAQQLQAAQQQQVQQPPSGGQQAQVTQPAMTTNGANSNGSANNVTFPGAFVQNQAAQNTATGGLPFALIGASPLQQQLSALSGLTNPGAFFQQLAPSYQQPSGEMQPPLAPVVNPNQLQLAALAGLNPQQLLQLVQQQQQVPAMPAPALTMQQLQQLVMTQQLLSGQALNPLVAMFGGGIPGLVPMAGFPFNLTVQPQAQAPQFPTLGAPAPPDLSAAAAALLNARNEAPKAAAPFEWAEPFAGKGKKEPPFPLKLHQILSNPEFAECTCWNPHGRSWRILKPPVFEQIVIPFYFRHAKYASFMRQVNGWGFKRIVSGNDHNSYYHELFVRDNPQLCLKMKRIKKSESEKARQEHEQEDEEPAPTQQTAPASQTKPQALIPAPQPTVSPSVNLLAGLAGLQQNGVAGSGVPTPEALMSLLGNATLPNNCLMLPAGQIGLNIGNIAAGLSAFTAPKNLSAPTSQQGEPAAAASAPPDKEDEEAPNTDSSKAPRAPPPDASPFAGLGSALGGLAALDSATLQKLHEALTAAAGNQQALPIQRLEPQSVGTQGNAALLAAQIQAVTQPQSKGDSNTNSTDDDE